MNDVSLLATHETTVLYYITETIREQTKVKIKGKQSHEEAEEQIQQKKQRKRNWNVRASKRITN